MVILAPSERGQGYIRAVIEKNADWYQRFCADYPSSRSPKRKRIPRTAIRRLTTIRGLRQLAHGYAVNEYAHRLLGYIPGFLAEQQAQFQAEKRAYERQKREAKRFSFP